MSNGNRFVPERQIPEIFCDGIVDIGFGNDMIRIDLYSLSVTHKDASGKPQPEIRQRVVMSLQGFIGAFKAMEGMCQRLVDAKVLQATTDGGGSVSTAAPAAPPATPKSPNFR
ncbi:DUF3467 domain-containing protein [Azospirillaceae bacterium]